MGHLGTLPGVAVTPATHHRDNVLRPLAEGLQGLENVLEGVGRVGIVHDADNFTRAEDPLKPSVHGMQGRNSLQGFVRGHAQGRSGPKNGGRIVGVELPNQMHPAFALVHTDQGAIEVAFEDAHLDVGCPTKRVGDGFGGTIE